MSCERALIVEGGFGGAVLIAIRRAFDSRCLRLLVTTT
jgi:hypothetical protein